MRRTPSLHAVVPALFWLCLNAGGVTVETNVTYAVGAVNAHGGGGTRDLKLDVYRPAESERTGSALVLVHGGGFTGGDRTSPDMVDAALYFAQRGWVCFSIDYRLTTDDPPAPWWVELQGDPVLNAAHAATVDTKRAVRWVRARAADYGCDTNRIAALGHSAGAYCVVLASVTDEADFANDAGTATPDQWPDRRGKLNAGVEVSGGLEWYASAFDASDPPLMIWHGDADTVVPYSEAEEIAAECVAHRIPHRFFTLAGKDHGVETWLALHEGRDVKAHAYEFLGRFFDLHVDIAEGGVGAVRLTWPSVSNAVYDVRSAGSMSQPFTNVVKPAVTSMADTCAVDLPMSAATEFYRVGVLSVGRPR